MSQLSEIATKIIKEQELIIGPIAWDEASKVPGLVVGDTKGAEVTITVPDEKAVINGLVSQYEHFFGRAAKEVCKDSVASLLADMPADTVPSSLQ